MENRCLNCGKLTKNKKQKTKQHLAIVTKINMKEKGMQKKNQKNLTEYWIIF